MIGIKLRGSFQDVESYLTRLKNYKVIKTLEQYGQQGVEALRAATPVDTGLTASSWYYKIEQTRTGASLIFCNSNINKNVNIAVILQYGHGTRGGTWVEGRDYINPALKPIFDEISAKVWEEVTRL